MHYAVLAQHLIVGLALWVVVDGTPAIVAAHLKISVNHSSLINSFNSWFSSGARLEVFALGLVMVHILAAFAMHTDDRVVAVGLASVNTIQADAFLFIHIP